MPHEIFHEIHEVLKAAEVLVKTTPDYTKRYTVEEHTFTETIYAVITTLDDRKIWSLMVDGVPSGAVLTFTTHSPVSGVVPLPSDCYSFSEHGRDVVMHKVLDFIKYSVL